MSRELLIVFGAILVAALTDELAINDHHRSRRIIGGEAAKKLEFPYHVSLQYGASLLGPFKNFCGGSIIKSEWILTAAHCISEIRPNESFIIKAGKHNIEVKECNEQMIEVGASIVHKNYKDYQLSDSPYDLGLLKLKTPLILNKAVSTISLPKMGAKPSGYGTLSGWGAITPYGTTYPSILQKIHLPIITHQECASQLKRIEEMNTFNQTHMCTGTRFPEQGSCKGDSGSPLMQKNASGTPELIGFVSWGATPCDLKNTPSIYIDVAQFVDWIEDTIKNNSI